MPSTQKENEMQQYTHKNCIYCCIPFFSVENNHNIYRHIKIN
jgi:hypothetical protein